MTKKKKKTPKESASNTLESLNRRGNAALGGGRYKEAIKFYKLLLKQDPHERWHHRLADAYLGRARELAGNGMYKEANALLETGAQHNQAENSLLLSILWSICAGQSERAVNTFLEGRDHLTDDEIDYIEALFALAAAAGQENLLQSLPEESKLRSHFSAAQSSIQAYCQGDDAKLVHYLKTIPFRSPYRDLRLILSALYLSAKDSKSAVEKLSKIPASSPFKVAAMVSQIAVEDELKIDKGEGLSNGGRSFIGDVRGIDKRSFDLFLKVTQVRDSTKAIFKEFMQNASTAENTNIKTLCYRLLPHYPEGIKAYENRFGQLSNFELCRIGALAFEKKGEYEKAGCGWEQAFDALSKEPSSKKTKLMQAMLLRRAAECADRCYGLYSENAEELLEQSLEFDPDDLATFHNLLKLYKAIDDSQNYRNCVERAIQQFPEDSGVLMAAVELAIERNTFKKAAALAKTMLKRDPINKGARSLLINAHLSHAGKQIVIGRFDLATKEIDEAEKVERSASPSGLIPLHRGLLEYAKKNEPAGEQLIEQTCRLMGSYPGVYFKIVVEMSRLKIPARYRKKYASLLKNVTAQKPDKKIVINLIKDIQKYLAFDEIDLHSAILPLKKYLSAAVSLDFSREEMELICDTFQTLEDFQRLKNFASSAVKRWPDNPIFVYFLVYARTTGLPVKMSRSDSQSLQLAIEKATQQNNIRTANRLIEYLESGHFFTGFGQPEFMGVDIDAVLDEIFGSMPGSKFP